MQICFIHIIIKVIQANLKFSHENIACKRYKCMAQTYSCDPPFTRTRTKKENERYKQNDKSTRNQHRIKEMP